MFAAARQGESAGAACAAFPGRSILYRVALACALLAGLLWLPRAHAGALYQCTGSGGETVYSSTTTGYSGCHKVASFADSSRPTTPARARKPAASLAGVHGWVQTTARLVSFADIEGSVDTTARAVDAGRWNYREDPADAAVAAAPGNRVLRGAVYRVEKADGSVEYTNLAPGGGKGRAVTTLFTYIATCAACNLHSTIDWNRVRLNLTAYADAVRAASAASGVDEAFLRAVIHAESAFNPNALSLKGAQGLMQLMPGTASDMGVLDAFDAAQNIRGGARYLAQLLKTFDGDERLAAAAYNAGPGAVLRYNGVPPFAETQVYVKRVGELRRRYGAAVHGAMTAMRSSGAP
ncbi:lytic transglycosylase domain-containing protein [Frateuria edaphi]|jgi:soluble lytic murein transglycosylase-like protein|uniref:lytic transglycosylase domain-containing protein n=1 Tax=Frateuria edaphi TaxID=2898793 RepID=UPI001E2922E1|nr:lytic transglycosylase domain-containing protein [Frateuria edaphi]UGB46572.1 lytic transglycosylase domain-containing protein [Frateuria edaphi]